jgi:SAM-dependent methyltransferase
VLDEIKGIIHSWHLRANGYVALTRRYPLMRLYAERLVDLLPAGFEGMAIDVGGGHGVSATALLERFPGARVTVFEPAAAMRELARDELARFGARMEIREGAAHEIPAREYDAAISNAVMHVLDEREVLPVIGAALKPGARFAFNLWGHSWAPVGDESNPSAIWEPALEQALLDLKIGKRPPKPERSKPVGPRLRDPDGMAAAARAGGMEVVSTTVDVDPVPAAFFLDFMAMTPRFMPKLVGPPRNTVLNRAREIAATTVDVPSVRFLLEKR